MRVSLVYGALAMAWVHASDRLLEALGIGAAAHGSLQTYKGLGFVALTSVLIYLLLRADPVSAQAAPEASPSGGRRLSFIVAGVSALLIFAILANLAFNLWLGHKTALEGAEQDAGTLVRVIEAQTSASINAANFALISLQDTVVDADSPSAGAGFARRAAQILRLLPFLRGIIHVDASGRVRHASTAQTGERTEIAQRDYFQHHRDHATDQLYIGEPFTSQVTGKPIFTLSRRLSDSAGGFAGVLVASVETAWFEERYGSLDARHGRSIVFARRDGTVLVRNPPVQAVMGRSFASLPLFSTYLPASPAGTYRSAGAGDGVRRIFAYRAVPERPLVVVLGLSERDVLAPWRQQGLAYGAIAAAAILTVIWLTYLALREIRRRGRLSAELHESEERFRLLWQTCADAVLVIDDGNRIRFANPAVSRIFGHEPKQLQGQALSLLQPARLAAAHSSALARYLGSGGKTLDWRSVQTTAVHRDGHEFPVEIAFSDHEFRGQRLFAGFVRDISERMRSQADLEEAKERLQALSEQLLRVQEAERAHLARELHDEFGQTLTALKLQLQMLGSREASSHLEDCLVLVEQALRQMKDLSLDLRPPQLDAFGLAVALRAHVTRLSERVPAPIQFECAPGVPQITGALAVALFRIAQEAITNALRHANAARIRVTLSRTDSLLQLTVDDDGTGFDVPVSRALAAKGRSLGLLSMQERAHMAGGIFEVHSAPGAGTTVDVRVPLHDEEGATA